LSFFFGGKNDSEASFKTLQISGEKAFFDFAAPPLSLPPTKALSICLERMRRYIIISNKTESGEMTTTTTTTTTTRKENPTFKK
jgi:hypothetical protein